MGSDLDFILLKLLADARRKINIVMDKLEAKMILNHYSCLAKLIDKYENITANNPSKCGASSSSDKNPKKRDRKAEEEEDANDAMMKNLDA